MNAPESGTLKVVVEGRGVTRCAATTQQEGRNSQAIGGFSQSVRPGRHVYRHQTWVYQRGKFLVCGWIDDPLGNSDVVAHTTVTIYP